jgi:Skp family chaperone for outer membrane proteins
MVMKKLFLLLMFLPFVVLAQNQSDTSRIIVTEDVKECVQEIYDNPQALKLIMSMLMGDKEKMREVRQELMQDPSMQQMMRDMQREMRDEQGTPHHQEGMHQQKDMPDQEPTDTETYDRQPTDTYEQQPTDTYEQQPTDTYEQQPTDTYEQQQEDTPVQEPTDTYDEQQEGMPEQPQIPESDTTGVGQF